MSNKRDVYYGRVSTAGQNIDRQLTDKIKEQFAENDIFIDYISGSIALKNRPQGSKLLDLVKQGKIKSLTVHSLDRFGRNLHDIQENIYILEDKNVNFISIKEGLRTLNDDGTKNRINELLIIVLGWFADFELARITERRIEGIEAYKRKTPKHKRKVRGKGEKMKPADIIKKYPSIYEFLKLGKGISETAKLTSKHRNTVYKVKNAMEEIKQVDLLDSIKEIESEKS